LVLPTIAQTLGLREAGGQPIAVTLADSLRDKQLLLLLDNFEQVVVAATAVARLLETCAGLKVLVTSRMALHLRGEKQVQVRPLLLPDPAHLPPPQHLVEYPAVALFVQRAQDADAAFALTNATALAVAAICARLDGLPLAIELAAAKVRVLAPPALLARLERQLLLLTGGARDLPERQQAMRNTLVWSYDLLQPAEQRLFRRLAVFVGGWTLEAAEAVSVISEEAEPLGPDLLDGLGTLADQSLIQEESSEPRFTMLQVIREFALEQLEASGEGEAMRRRHAEYLIRCVGPSARWELGLRLHEDLLAQELANARVALMWARDRGEAALGLHLAAAFGQIWFVRGLTGEGRAWLENMLARNAGADEQAVPVSVRLIALFGASEFARSQGDYAQAEDWARKCVDLAQGAGDLSAAGSALTLLAATAQGRGDLARATELYEESLMRYREAGTEDGIGRTMINLGNLLVMRGDYARALPLLEQVLAHARVVGSSFAIANGLNSLANAARAQGDFRRAVALHLESLPLYREIGNKGYIALCLEGLAAARLGEGRYKDSARLCAAAATLRAEAHAPLPKPEQEAYDWAVAAARAALGYTAFAEAWASGQALSLEEAITEALGEEERASVITGGDGATS
jgi:predicted ATPase